MHYEPTRSWLLTSGADKVIKVSQQHTHTHTQGECWMLWVTFPSVCVSVAVGYDPRGVLNVIMTIASGDHPTPEDAVAVTTLRTGSMCGGAHRPDGHC